MNGTLNMNAWHRWSFLDPHSMNYPHNPTFLLMGVSPRIIFQDGDFFLFGATIFKKSRDQFSQKCRENRHVAKSPFLRLLILRSYC